MTISSSMNAGVMGLQANSTRLASVADNIANSDTKGYKRAVTDFQSLVTRSQASKYVAGGVRADTVRAVGEQGSLIRTGNPTDMAIGGRGFLPTTSLIDAINGGDRELLLTSTGSFALDKDGFMTTGSGLVLMGWEADANGDIGAVTRQSSADLKPVRFPAESQQSTPKHTENVNVGVNLPANATGAGEAPAPYDVSLEYFDDFGRSQKLSMVFTPQIPANGSSDRWDVEVFDNAMDPPTSLSQFEAQFGTTDRAGRVIAIDGAPNYDPATGNLTVTTATGDIDLHLGGADSKNGMTQLASEFKAFDLKKDGSPVADLKNLEIDGLGRLQAIYEGGFVKTLYQIPVADVSNPSGMTAEDNQAFRVSPASGDVYFWDAGTGPVGDVVGYSLMESSADVATELTNLIETQRAYSSNAKIIRAVDEMLQETNNIVR